MLSCYTRFPAAILIMFTFSMLFARAQSPMKSIRLRGYELGKLGCYARLTDELDMAGIVRRFLSAAEAARKDLLEGLTLKLGKLDDGH